MHIYYNADCELFISCRGPREDDQSILQLMWLAMKPAIKAIEGTLSKYEGIVYKVQLANTYMYTVCDSFDEAALLDHMK